MNNSLKFERFLWLLYKHTCPYWKIQAAVCIFGGFCLQNIVLLLSVSPNQNTLFLWRLFTSSKIGSSSCEHASAIVLTRKTLFRTICAVFSIKKRKVMVHFLPEYDIISMRKSKVFHYYTFPIHFSGGFDHAV